MTDLQKDALSLRMLAAWMNVRVDQLPPENRTHLNPVMMAAWQRVGEAAAAHVTDQHISDAVKFGYGAAIAVLRADAEQCDCFAREADECACGAWIEYKTVPIERLISLLEETPVPAYQPEPTE